MPRLFRICANLALVTSVLMFAPSAHALWNESIRITGEERLPQGASATLMLDTGQEIEGEVREDEDGQFLLFYLPGNEPRPGTLTITTAAGERTYLHGTHTADQTMALDLSAETTAVMPLVPPIQTRTADTRVRLPDRLAVSLGARAAHWQSDYFREQIDRNTEALIPILDDFFGGTGSSARGSADDSGSEYGLVAGLTYNFSQNHGIYVEAGYSEMSAADGSVVGRTDVAGNDVVVLASGESAIDVYTLAVGYIRAFPRSSHWRWYAGIGAMRLDMEDESVTRTLVNGTEVDRFSGSGSDKDNAEFLEAGIRYEFARFAKKFGVSIDVGVRVTDETFNGEEISSLSLTLRAGMLPAQ